MLPLVQFDGRAVEVETKSWHELAATLVEVQGGRRRRRAVRSYAGRSGAEHAADRAGGVAVLAVADEKKGDGRDNAGWRSPANAPIPSSASGVGLPSDMIEPGVAEGHVGEARRQREHLDPALVGDPPRAARRLGECPPSVGARVARRRAALRRPGSVSPPPAAAAPFKNVRRSSAVCISPPGRTPAGRRSDAMGSPAARRSTQGIESLTRRSHRLDEPAVDHVVRRR